VRLNLAALKRWRNVDATRIGRQAMKNGTSKSAQIRARLNHPIIDSDAHIAEFEPAFFDFLKATAGGAMVERFKSLADSPMVFRWYRLTPEQRRELRAPRPIWWGHPSGQTLDRATSSLPRLHHQRLDEMGLDFAIVYPSFGMFMLHVGDDEMRRALCRAYNDMHAQLFSEHADRMTPAAMIPMHTPDEAIAELEHAARDLRLKVILMPAFARRRLAAQSAPGFWIDNFCLDSEFDYDPVWAKCQELKLAPTFHSPSAGFGFRGSISNFVYNHIGHFAASAESICKALFLGGVPHRYPQLRFAFMEGGAAWAAALLSDLIGHWEKRNREAMRNFAPDKLDWPLLRKLFVEYGAEYGEAALARVGEDKSYLLWGSPEDPEHLDEFARCGIRGKQDIVEQFSRSFFFGCEGDDRLTAIAFDTRKNPMGTRLGALYSSDAGHFDLPDMRRAAEEAFELVEDGLITEADFRDFVFTNPVRAKAGLNPDFFKATRVEQDVARLLSQKHQTARPSERR
jgi:predicted TIM-barrel fold metal-dependent hydrolase